MPVYQNPASQVQTQAPIIDQQSQQAPGAVQSVQAPTLQTQDDMIVKALVDRLKFNQKGSQQMEAMGGGCSKPQGGGNPSQSYLSYKIPKLMHEGYTAPGQAYAVARSMYGQGGGGDVCAKCMKSHPGMECEMEQGGGGYQLPTRMY